MNVKPCRHKGNAGSLTADSQNNTYYDKLKASQGHRKAIFVQFVYKFHNFIIITQVSVEIKRAMKRSERAGCAQAQPIQPVK